MPSVLSESLYPSSYWFLFHAVLTGRGCAHGSGIEVALGSSLLVFGICRLLVDMMLDIFSTHPNPHSSCSTLDDRFSAFLGQVSFDLN